MILTPLPTADEDRLSSKTSGEGAGSAKQDTKDQSDTNHDHSDQAHDIPKPRMTEHDRPTQGGTNSKAHQHKPSAHYEITSPGLRWAAHDLRTKLQTDTDNVIRRKKNKFQRVDDGEEKNTDGDDSQGQSRSSVNFAAVDSGIMVFLFIFAGLARLW